MMTLLYPILKGRLDLDTKSQMGYIPDLENRTVLFRPFHANCGMITPKLQQVTNYGPTRYLWYSLNPRLFGLEEQLRKYKRGDKDRGCNYDIRHVGLSDRWVNRCRL